MELKGQVVDIIYQNEINSYMIATFEMENEITTIVGYLPFINSGDMLKVVGKYVEHKEYGLQFKVDTFEKLMPETVAGLEKYLANGNIKGVGPATAKKIVELFGKETVHVLKFEPDKLSRIKGISKAKAQEISESFVENWEVWQIVGFLEKFGIGAENAKKVYDMFGVNAIDEIESNPYILIDIARGVDFNQIDKMALDLGIDYTNSKRVKSGIKYALIRSTYNGHCCVLKQNLLDFVKQLLNVDEDIIDDNIIKLKVDDEIIIEIRDNGQEWIYLYNFYKSEEDVARLILKLDNYKNVKKIRNIEAELNKAEKNIDIYLSDKQKDTIKAINDNNVTIITGGPGTGKTTVIKTIIDIYNQKKYKTVLCAPTGRAAKRMTETTGEEASTLHRLLEIRKINDDYLKKQDNEYEGMPIDADLIIVDELSMVDIFLMRYLLKCIYPGTKLVLVGDSDQLSSVGPGNVLKDLILSGEITTVHLDKIFRQAAKSKIILNAHRVNSGMKFLSKEEDTEETKEDFFFIKESSQEAMLNQVISLCTGRLKKFGDYDFFSNIQVLTPTKKGMLGTKELNKALQQVLNPYRDGESEKSSMGSVYRIQDRVMQIKNNYDMQWEKSNGELGTGVFNGEMGTILEIDEKNKCVQIKFDDEKTSWYEYSELDQIEHSYSITIHKAQGSEFDVVIMPIAQSAPMLLTRNLLYTGITRAKKLLIIISTDKIIDFMIQNIDSKKRNTGLEYKIKMLAKT